MFTAILIFHIVCCVFLVVIVLMQASKDEGLSGAFGAGGGQAIFGSRTGDILTRATTILAITFMVTSLVLARLSAYRSEALAGGIMPPEATAEIPAEPSPAE